MSDLKKQAEELGITVNARWSEETLQKKIDEALATPATPAPGTEPFGGKGDHDGDGKPGGATPAASKSEPDSAQADVKTYVLKRDYWDEEGNRIPAGTEVSFADDQAVRLGANVLQAKTVF